MAARKSKTTKSDDKADASSAAKDIVKRVRDRLKVMKEADDPNRRLAMDDLKFVNVPGFQWDDLMRKERGLRPCYEFNELRIKCKRIINDMRANRPQVKIRGTEDGDVETADVLEGLCRNIWNTSDADTTLDNAGEYQVSAGMAAWRVVTNYASELSFDQDLYIEAIRNPFCLYCDPASQDPFKRDAEDWILTERISKAAYEARWKGKEVVSFGDEEFDDESEWNDGETVRIAEHWYKEPIDVEIAQLADGKVIDLSSEAGKLLKPDEIVRRRKVKSHKIMMTIVSGDAVLEKPQRCAGKEHRFIMIFGESMVIDGKTVWFGLPRFAKDAQRNLNVTHTAAVEMTAMSLQSKFWVTTKQAEGQLEAWAEAFKKNVPVVAYTPDPANGGGPPQRMAGPELPIAMLQLGQQASELMKSVTGIHDASLGADGPERSGRAIIARQQQGEVATFNFQDNMVKGAQRTYEILLDLIPEVIDTERSIRILGSDGAEKYVKVNTFKQDPQTGKMVALHDLKQGKYDVTMSVGPNFQTLRQEAAETWASMASSDPNLMMAAGDLVYKSMDVPYADEIAERMKAMLPPPIQQMLQQDEKNIPPEARSALNQANQAMQVVQQQGQLVQQASQELEQSKADAEKSQAQVQTAIADLETKKAQFEAFVAKQMAALQIKEMQFQSLVDKGGNDQERQNLAGEVQKAVAELQQGSADFAQQVLGTLADVMAKQQTQVIVPPKPKIIAIKSKRVNGELTAIPIYEGDITMGQMQ